MSRQECFRRIELHIEKSGWEMKSHASQQDDLKLTFQVNVQNEYELKVLVYVFMEGAGGFNFHSFKECNG